MRARLSLPLLNELPHVNSTRALEASLVYARLRPDIDRLLATVATGTATGPPRLPLPHIRAVAWNIERGLKLEGILAALARHPALQDADVLLLTELDEGMARSRNLSITREIAGALNLHYAFAPCYLSLVKGSGLEVHAEGENDLGLHGNAILSRWPLRDAHGFKLANGKDLMAGKEKRLGCQQAVVALLDHPSGPLRVVSLHLDAHSSQRHRHRQMRSLLDHLDRLEPRLPTLIGGDWNTSTFNSSRALYAILGYWLRVLMGPARVIRDHYPHPDRCFERHLFRELLRRGYAYRELNQDGAGTVHYDVANLAVNSGLRDWVPAWCFPFIRWALSRHGGRCSLKLDWFAGKGVRAAGEPRVVADAGGSLGAVSDHDPIVLDLSHEGAAVA